MNDVAGDPGWTLEFDDPDLEWRRLFSELLGTFILVLFIALCAFGDSIIGNPLRDMLGQDDDATREILARVIPMFFL